MSFKCIYLKNCEILINELESITGNLNNENGINQELSMPISFERHYSYNINKEFNLMVSDSGYIENSGSIGKTVNAKNPEPVNEPNWDDVENDR